VMYRLLLDHCAQWYRQILFVCLKLTFAIFQIKIARSILLILLRRSLDTISLKSSCN
jgi:hypothetical protein